MADKQLTLNQQIALIPAAIPDSILDFIEDFNYGTSLQTESVRASFDPEYLMASGESLKAELEALRAEGGKLIKFAVDAAGREIPGAYILQLNFEKINKGIGLITRIKERTILKVVIQPGEYQDEALKQLLKNPPK